MFSLGALPHETVVQPRRGSASDNKHLTGLVKSTCFEASTIVILARNKRAHQLDLPLLHTSLLVALLTVPVATVQITVSTSKHIYPPLSAGELCIEQSFGRPCGRSSVVSHSVPSGLFGAPQTPRCQTYEFNAKFGQAHRSFGQLDSPYSVRSMAARYWHGVQTNSGVKIATNREMAKGS